MYLLLSASLVFCTAQTTPAVGERVVVVPVANMYSSPTTQDADVVSQGFLGSNFGVLELQKDWAKVRTSDQYTGWMRLSDSLQQNGGTYASKGRWFRFRVSSPISIAKQMLRR